MNFKNEIEKLINKWNPTAKKFGVDGEFVTYRAYVKGIPVGFRVPVEEVKGLNEEEPAQLLIKWLKVPCHEQE